MFARDIAVDIRVLCDEVHEMDQGVLFLAFVDSERITQMKENAENMI